MIIRRKSKQTTVCWLNQIVTIGGNAPIRIQSMTNTNTEDIIDTAMQIKKLAQAGSELVRITVNTEKAAAAVPKIREYLDKMTIYTPLIGDFHYNGHILLKKYPDCARSLSKYRINPGNVGYAKKRDLQFAEMIELACLYKKPIRIGVNWGSLDQELLTKLFDQNSKAKNPKESHIITADAVIQSALDSAKKSEEWGMPKHQIIISCKVSVVQYLIYVYRNLANLCQYPLHLGLTEAGMGSKGIVASTAALSILLQEGIGDTIRISLTPEPGGSREKEVFIAKEILQTMDIRKFHPMVTACPGCGRTSSTYFQELAMKIQDYLNQKMPLWKEKYSGVECMNVAVMGCIVNGPGESKQANIGISLPGSNENPIAPVFIDGKKATTLRGEAIAEDFQSIIDQYVKNTYKN